MEAQRQLTPKILMEAQRQLTPKILMEAQRQLTPKIPFLWLLHIDLIHSFGLLRLLPVSQTIMNSCSIASLCTLSELWSINICSHL